MRSRAIRKLRPGDRIQCGGRIPGIEDGNRWWVMIVVGTIEANYRRMIVTVKEEAPGQAWVFDDTGHLVDEDIHCDVSFWFYERMKARVRPKVKIIVKATEKGADR